MPNKFAIAAFRFFIAGGGLSVGNGRLFVQSALVGLVVGFVAVAFHGLIDVLDGLLLHGVGAYASLLAEGTLLRGAAEWADGRRWLLLALPAAGAALAALLIRWISPGTHARGTDSAIYVYHRLRCRMSWRIIPVKAVASALVISSGGSAGYEGPMTLIGAACGTNLARVFHWDAATRRRLMIAGLAAGIGALFRAPLAGALFGAEILYSGLDMEYEALLPAFIASAMSYTVYAFFYGWAPMFAMPSYVYDDGLRLVPYLLLALVVSLGAKFYIYAFRRVSGAFRNVKGPPWAKVAVGGLLTGALGFFFPDVLGTGYDLIRVAFRADAEGLVSMRGAWSAAGLFFAAFVLKAVVTSFTVGSGGSGGVFGPALVCGATLSAACGAAFTALFPASFGIHPASVALVGMAGFLAATIRTPLTAVIMVAELSGNHALLLPTMWVCGLAFALNDGWSLYRSQVHSRASSPLHS
ncbi:MAG: chloride channel protein [Kiritimatiellia bacterium]